MAAEGKTGGNSVSTNKGKKRKYLPHGKPTRKGLHPLRPGLQGFFITCDGGREQQATREALNLLETFYEELVHGKASSTKAKTYPSKQMNKVIKFKDSDSSSDEDESPSESKASHVGASIENAETQGKKQRLEESCDKEKEEPNKDENKSFDDQIEEELSELRDRDKMSFTSLDSGCNGVIFIGMHKRDGDPGPSRIVQHMMSSAAATRKHMSRFILRVLPAELTCYASEEEISKAIKPLIGNYFPCDAQSPQKFAVLYEARSNTGIERMSIINAVAKSVPQPHKVDLNNPDKTIIVQIVKTICLVGVIERYKELAKYNLRQLTSPKS